MGPTYEGRFVFELHSERPNQKVLKKAIEGLDGVLHAAGFPAKVSFVDSSAVEAAYTGNPALRQALSAANAAGINRVGLWESAVPLETQTATQVILMPFEHVSAEKLYRATYVCPVRAGAAVHLLSIALYLARTRGILKSASLNGASWPAIFDGQQSRVERSFIARCVGACRDIGVELPIRKGAVWSHDMCQSHAEIPWAPHRLSSLVRML